MEEVKFSLTEQNAEHADKNEVYHRFISELKKRIKSLEVIDKDFSEIRCTLRYGVSNWTKENSFQYSKNKMKMSSAQDIKFSVMLSRVQSFLGNNTGAFDEECAYIEKNKICITLFLVNPALVKEENVQNSVQKSESKLSLVAEKPRFHWNQLIVNDAVAQELRDTVQLIKNRSKIYDEWGFSEIDSVPHCVINFYGAPGTGKTMSAHILADELGINILPLNYADIESKYVGDAPKNLVAAFDCAQEQNALLFFDEADSFLGKRITNVQNGSDQAVNSLRSQLLMLLESRDTIVVFATNLQENYDTAFNSRILKNIKFELPDTENRQKIIRKMIPQKVPLAQSERTEDFYTRLSELTDGFAPREIKNAVLNTLIRACNLDGNISAAVFYDVFAHEKQVHNDILENAQKRRKELGERIKQNIQTNNFAVVKQQNDEEKSV